MRMLFVAVLLVSGIFAGCSRNYFNVPADNFAQRVKVLGVVPIIADGDSDIRHPQKEQLLQMVTEMNRKYEQQLVRKIKGNGSFYTVALMDGDPQRIFNNLLFRRERRDDAAIQYNKYFFKNDELRDYVRKNNLDAVMFVVVSGLTRTDKIYSSNLLSSLTSDYNFLTMTAQISDPDGTILWEYPNFRQTILSYPPMINLQYPDFSEAEANLSKKANLKFKAMDGIQRSFEKKRKDMLFRETQETEIYGRQFDEILGLLKFDSGTDKSASGKSPEKPAASLQPKAAEPAPAYEIKPAAPPRTVAPALPLPEPPKAPLFEAPKHQEDIIVPATKSTL